jgi:hypothetical protein
MTDVLPQPFFGDQEILAVPEAGTQEPAVNFSPDRFRRAAEQTGGLGDRQEVKACLIHGSPQKEKSVGLPEFQ